MYDQVPIGLVHRHKEFGPKPTPGAFGLYPQNQGKMMPCFLYAIVFSVLFSASWDFTRNYGNRYLERFWSEKSDFQKIALMWFSKMCFSVFWRTYVLWCKSLRNVLHISETPLALAITWWIQKFGLCIFSLNKILKIWYKNLACWGNSPLQRNNAPWRNFLWIKMSPGMKMNLFSHKNYSNRFIQSKVMPMFSSQFPFFTIVTPW